MAHSIQTLPALIQDTLLGRMKTETLFAAIRFKIPDYVHELEPNADLETISSKLKLPASTLSRFLNACVTLGILDISTSNEKDYYTTTSMAKEWLLSSSKRSFVGFINFQSYLEQDFLLKLSDALILGENRFQGGAKLYHEISVNPELAEMVTEGMASMCQTAISAIDSFDLSKYKTVIDIGGGVGIFAADLMTRYTDLIVNVLELPVTISQAETYWAKRGGQPNFNFIQGDMFKSVPAADLYTMGHVLMDYPDERCNQILSNITKAMKPGGAVLLLEKVLPDIPTPTSCRAHMADMYLMCVPLIAKRRTLKEYRHLLEKAGFRDVQYRENVNNPYYDAILATKM